MQTSGSGISQVGSQAEPHDKNSSFIGHCTVTEANEGGVVGSGVVTSTVVVAENRKNNNSEKAVAA